MKWEHTTVAKTVLPSNFNTVDSEVNKLGEKGWKPYMSNVTSLNPSDKRFLYTVSLRRTIEEES